MSARPHDCRYPLLVGTVYRCCCRRYGTWMQPLDPADVWAMFLRRAA